MLLPILIARLNASTFVKQCGSPITPPVLVPWGVLNESGPSLGYFPNAKKCRIIVKPEKEEAARDLFGQTSINISIQGHKHLGAALGSRSYIKEYVSEKEDDWVGHFRW